MATLCSPLFWSVILLWRKQILNLVKRGFNIVVDASKPDAIAVVQAVTCAVVIVSRLANRSNVTHHFGSALCTPYSADLLGRKELTVRRKNTWHVRVPNEAAVVDQ